MTPFDAAGRELLAVRRDAALIDALARRDPVMLDHQERVLCLLAGFVAGLDDGLDAVAAREQVPDGLASHDERRTTPRAGGRRGTARTAVGVTVVAVALSVGGVAAAVTGDPLTPYRRVLDILSGPHPHEPSPHPRVSLPQPRPRSGQHEPRTRSATAAQPPRETTVGDAGPAVPPVARERAAPKHAGDAVDGTGEGDPQRTRTRGGAQRHQRPKAKVHKREDPVKFKGPIRHAGGVARLTQDNGVNTVATGKAGKDVRR